MVTGTLADLDEALTYRTILYIDVLEHIEDDRAEMQIAASRLAPGGYLVVLSPSFQFLYSEFDRQIGHWRRYTKATLEDAMPSSLVRAKLVYLDSVGMLLSLGNRLLLRAGQPSEAQIRLWDRRVVPVSRILDPLLGWRVGKTVVGVWRRPS